MLQECMFEQRVCAHYFSQPVARENCARWQNKYFGGVLVGSFHKNITKAVRSAALTMIYSYLLLNASSIEITAGILLKVNDGFLCHHINVDMFAVTLGHLNGFF
jgi:hypothetical protein